MILLYVTFGSMEEARKISRSLVENDLVACANLLPSTAVYKWKGKLKEEGETACLLKTRKENFEKIAAYVCRNHSYETPCILKLEAKADKQFGEWVCRTVKL